MTSEENVMRVLIARGRMASTVLSISEAVGLAEETVNRAVTRLVGKNLAHRWRDDDNIERIVRFEDRKQAFWFQSIKLPDIYSFFGHDKLEFSILRSKANAHLHLSVPGDGYWG